MKYSITILLTLFTLAGCSTVNIIDSNPNNPAEILKSEMSGLSAYQTSGKGNLRSTLDYVNKKLRYGEKIFYSTTFKKFVFARFSDEYKLFEMSELDMANASIRIQGGSPKKSSNNNRLIIPAKNKEQGFDLIHASGKREKSPQLVFRVDVASDAIKVKNAFILMTNPENHIDQSKK